MKNKKKQERLITTNHIQNEKKEFGERIKQIRVQSGLTQEQFAASVDMSNTNLSGIEAGKKNPKLDFFFKLVKIYHVSLDYLFLGIGSPQLQQKNTNRSQVDDIITTQDFDWYMVHSSIFRDTMMSYGAKFLYDNEDIIKRNIQKLKQNQKEKKTGDHTSRAEQE